MSKRHAPATLRNRDAILAVLQRIAPQDGVLLEIASGTGEHAAYMASNLPGPLRWQPSDGDADALSSIDAHAAGNPRILPALLVDVTARKWPIDRAAAMFCANMIHIAPWQASEGLFAGAGRVLTSGAPLVLYGPFKRDGAHTAPSNEAFDASLRSRDPSWGVRCLDSEIAPLAKRHGLVLGEIVPMPANNLSVIFRRR
ncbi:MAG: SAM-dependent methyltransferase [Alphaproteobacteria bacterium]|nr:SAM-dependent methyltransferase [Alphaproteobacteria bacterium]